MAALSVLAASVAAAFAAPPAHAVSAAQLDARGHTRIIVKREPGLTRSERAQIRADADVTFERRLTVPRTEVVEAEPGELAEALERLAEDPAVVYAGPDAPISSATADPLWGELWALDNTGQSILGAAGLIDADVDAPEAWEIASGAGETIAVVDSGVELDHPDLAGALAVNPGEAGELAANGIDDDANGLIDDYRGWDWVGTGDPDGEEDGEPEDGHGHGTHVAGIIAARLGNGIGVAGVAPDARVFPLRILDDRASGYLSDAVEAFDYAGENGYRIVNASLGLTVSPEDEATMDSVRALYTAIAAHPETLYVVAAGNGDADNDVDPFYPCALPAPNVVCVGASDSSDRRARFSNWGLQSVDLHAPGVLIRSTVRFGGYGFLSGTSMAAPLAAGAAALVRATDSSVAAAAVKRRLLDGADPLPWLVGESVTGARLNAAAAVQPEPSAAAETTAAAGDVAEAASPAPGEPADEAETPAEDDPGAANGERHPTDGGS